MHGKGNEDAQWEHIHWGTCWSCTISTDTSVAVVERVVGARGVFYVSDEGILNDEDEHKTHLADSTISYNNTLDRLHRFSRWLSGRSKL